MIKKQFMCYLLALIMLLGGIPVAPLAETSNTAVPTRLRVDLREDPYGVDSMDPAFSWAMNDPQSNEFQTAYRLVISQTSALRGEVLDTGWIQTNQNTGVHAAGIADVLKENELYYWQVQTKDKEGNQSDLSQAACFMTHIGKEWQSLDGVWPTVDKNNVEMTHYQVEQTMSIATGDALALLANMDNAGKNGYMVQIRNVDNAVKFHQITNGTINTAAFKTVSLSEYGITLPADTTPFGVKLICDGTDLSLELKTGAQYISAGTVSVANYGNRGSGVFGYRTGGRESGTIDDVKVVSLSGETLYATDFSENDGRFGSLRLSGGKLSVGKGSFACFVDGTVQNYANFAFFRSPLLTIDPETVDKAIISLSTRGTTEDRSMMADLYFNGICLGAGSAREVEDVGSFAGVSDYTKVFYNSFDATPYLANGHNVIGVAGNCMDSNRGLLVQMTLFNKDGTKEIITNSSTENSCWKMLDGSFAFGDTGTSISTGYVSLLYDNVNMEEYPQNWATVSFDDSNWSAVRINTPVATAVTGITGRVLTPYCSENTLRVETDQTIAKVYKTKTGTLIVDLGKEIIGGLKVDLDMPAAGEVTVHRGEELNADGSVKNKLTATPTYADTWRLIKGKNAFETLTMRNFRYLELIGLEESALDAILAQPGSIKGWAMMQPFDEQASSFAATDGTDAAALLNRLYELSKYTIQATNQDVYVDSQARERAPYEGDLLVNANTSYSVSDNYSLARHSNEWLIDNPTWPNDYSIFMVEMAYVDLLYTGDQASVTEYYEALKRKLTVKAVYTDPATGLIEAADSQAGKTALIDWPLAERDGYKGSTYDVIFNAEYVGIYNYMANIARILGKTEEAEEYRARSEQLKNTLLTCAYDKDTGCFYDSLDREYKATQHSSVHATAYALCYGVYDSQEMADSMCAFVYSKCKDQFVGSIYATYFILKGLYNGNHGEMAEALLTIPTVATNFKSFASVLDDLNCTITPEAWGHSHKGNMTLSHPWGASPGCSLVQGMFGIYPTTPGFYTFDVKLQPGDIRSANVTTPTVQGAIRVGYQQTQEGIRVQVTVPANTVATVYLPVPADYTVFTDVEKGQVLDAKVLQSKWLTVELGSGEYDLTAISADGQETADYGDVNEDGSVNAQDALLVLKAAVGKESLTQKQFAASDVDGNGKLDALDALLILQKAVDKIEKFPVEE